MKTALVAFSILTMGVLAVAHSPSGRDGAPLSRPPESMLLRLARGSGSLRLKELVEELERRRWVSIVEAAVARGQVTCIQPDWSSAQVQDRPALLLNLLEMTGIDILLWDEQTENVRIYVAKEQAADLQAAMGTTPEQF